jgi:hypothetical protein
MAAEFPQNGRMKQKTGSKEASWEDTVESESLDKSAILGIKRGKPFGLGIYGSFL